jgi:hypothetical protein
VSAPDPQSGSAPDLKPLRNGFVVLLTAQGVLTVIAVAFAMVYFIGRQGWGLPAFAVTLGLTAAAQIGFIWTVGKRRP